jgi:hypothetical protein
MKAVVGFMGVVALLVLVAVLLLPERRDIEPPTQAAPWIEPARNLARHVAGAAGLFGPTVLREAACQKDGPMFVLTFETGVLGTRAWILGGEEEEPDPRRAPTLVSISADEAASGAGFAEPFGGC